MFARTLREAKRLVILVVGLTLIIAGVAMFVTPGPGWLVIFAGLAVLGTEFVWARRLLRRLRREEQRLGAAIFGRRQDTGLKADPPRREAASAVRR